MAHEVETMFSAREVPWHKAEDRRYGQCLDCGTELRNEQKDPSIRKKMRYFIQTVDGKIAVRTVSVRGYTLCNNVAEQRKEWVQKWHAEEALGKIREQNSLGAQCLTIEEREL